MNRIWILAVALLLIGNYSKAQNAETNDKTNRPLINKPVSEPPFKITKGYYSIYRNAEKLNHQPITIVVNNNSVDNYPKGFYAISNKHTHLHKGGKSFIVTTPSRPLATKGYYSIKPPATVNSEENLIADGVDTTDVAREAN
jgi:hypothetical protein